MADISSQLSDWLRERQITEVEALVPDLTGNARGKIIPAYRFAEGQVLRLPECIFVQTVTGEWPDDEVYDALMDPADKDLYLKPDPDTACMVPWVEEPTAQIIHDCLNGNGELHRLAPRTVLRRVLELFEGDGIRPIVAPEVEFYLVQQNTDSDLPLQPPVGRSGRQERARQSYSIDAVNEFDPLFEDMYDFCEAMELDVETLIHESGAAQMEINFDHSDALSRADQVFLFKRMLREVAMRHGVCATFLAKPMENEPGSSMHLHQSLADAASGRNLMAAENGGGMSEMMRHYIGGLQKHADAAMAILAPNVNSYRRILYGESSPLNVHWGYDNRTAGLRVPISSPEHMRVESRFAGSDVNPYLAMAVTLACGYLGIRNAEEPSEEVKGSAYDCPGTLPRSLESALGHLERDSELAHLLGDDFVCGYVGVKRKEYETFFRVISSWEREHLLMNV